MHRKQGFKRGSESARGQAKVSFSQEANYFDALCCLNEYRPG